MEKQKQWEEEFLKRISDKFLVVTDEIENLAPYAVRENGKYPKTDKPGYGWVCGFYGGIQWWLYHLTGEEKFLKKAKEISEWMDGALPEFVSLNHDVGFQFLLTTVADYIATGSERAYVSGIHAATLMAGRFNPEGRYIRAWNDNKYIDPSRSKAGYIIVDCMMNIPLLFWAWQETGDPRFRQIAMLHADTTMQYFIRENGSSEHIVVMDPEKGIVVDKPKGQGYAEGSSWTRGQGWAIYGFAMAYHYTRKKEYLETSLRVAKNFLDKLPADGNVPVDFDQPETPAMYDESAAAIAVCGMIDLKKWVEEGDQELLEAGIRKLLKSLYDNSDLTTDNQSVVQNCKQMYHDEPVQQTSLIYADFYLLEALMKRRGETFLFGRK